MKYGVIVVALLCCWFSVGCSTPAANSIKSIELGMTPGEVLERMGEPYTIRAAQQYEDGRVTEIWEYISPMLSFNPRTFLVIFQNGKLVQWGVEGDLTGGGGFGR